MTQGLLTFDNPAPVAVNVGAAFCSRAANLLLGTTIVCQALPETVSEKAYLGKIPIDFLMFYAAGACFLIEAVISGSLWRKWPRQYIFVVPMVALMSISGLLGREDIRWWVIDASMIAGLLLGLFWGTQRSVSAATRTLCGWALLSSVLLLLNVFGLQFGLLTPMHYGVRVYSAGLFSCATYLTILLPFWFITWYHETSGEERSLRMFVILIALCCLTAACVISATRSILLAGLASCFLSYWVFTKNWLLAGTGIVILLVAGFCLPSGKGAAVASTNFIGQRFLETDLTEEDRWVEIELMFEAMDTTKANLIGAGFGSRFLTNIRVEEGKALSPHVGVLTTWYKGGLICFLGIIVYPLIRLTYRLIVLNRARSQLACCAGGLAYILSSSLSGGWQSLPLFFFGAFIALSERPREEFG